MKIDRVFIKGFGRLSDLTIDFTPHINIVYGENERGKSTLHRFIEQMFYHPYKTGYKKRQLSETLKRYKPWGKANFSGAMTISDGTVYRIEKDFTTKHPQVNIYDDAGNEISAQYQLDDVYREPQFGQHHFGLSKVMFKNTVSVGQISKQADKEAVVEIKKYVGNIERANDATISVQNVQARIKAEKRRIGRRSLKKSSYGKRETRLNELAEMRKQVAVIEAEIADLQVVKQQLGYEISQNEQRLQQIDNRLVAIKKIENNHLKQKADVCVAQIEKHKAEIKALQRYATFDYDTVSRLKKLKFDLDKALQAQHIAQRERDRIRTTYDQIDAVDATADDLTKLKKDSAKISEDHATISNLEAKCVALQSEISLLSTQRNVRPVVKPLTKSLLIVSVLGTLLITTGLAQLNFYIAAGALFLMLAWLAFYWQVRRKAVQLAITEKNSYNAEIEQLQGQLTIDKATINAILEHYQVADISQLNRKSEEIKRAILLIEMQRAEKAKQADKKANLATQLAVAERALQNIKDELVLLNEAKANQFAELAIDSFDQIDDFHQHYRQLEDIKRQSEHQTSLLQEALAGHNYTDLQFEAVSVDIALEDKQQLLIERENTSFHLIEKRKESEQIYEQIAALESRTRSLQSIEEEIDILLKERQADDKRLKVLDIIASKIELSIDNLQKTVMPEVNQTIRDIVYCVTDGKYDDIKVNGDLGVFVIDKDNHITVPLQQLSAGTIDLMYTGLRIGMADLLNANKTVPLFFDDTFSQIDNNRLTNLLAYLASLDRQILIFTCHQREGQILETLNVPYHKIEL